MGSFFEYCKHGTAISKHHPPRDGCSVLDETFWPTVEAELEAWIAIMSVCSPCRVHGTVASTLVLSRWPLAAACSLFMPPKHESPIVHLSLSLSRLDREGYLDRLTLAGATHLSTSGFSGQSEFIVPAFFLKWGAEGRLAGSQ